MGVPPGDVGTHWCCEPAYQWDAGASGHPGLLLRAVRHEALPYRMEVRDLRGLAVVAVG